MTNKTPSAIDLVERLKRRKLDAGSQVCRLFHRAHWKYWRGPMGWRDGYRCQKCRRLHEAR